MKPRTGRIRGLAFLLKWQMVYWLLELLMDWLTHWLLFCSILMCSFCYCIFFFLLYSIQQFCQFSCVLFYSIWLSRLLFDSIWLNFVLSDELSDVRKSFSTIYLFLIMCVCLFVCSQWFQRSRSLPSCQIVTLGSAPSLRWRLTVWPAKPKRRANAADTSNCSGMKTSPCERTLLETHTHTQYPTDRNTVTCFTFRA